MSVRTSIVIQPEHNSNSVFAALSSWSDKHLDTFISFVHIGEWLETTLLGEVDCFGENAKEFFGVIKGALKRADWPVFDTCVVVLTSSDYNIRNFVVCLDDNGLWTCVSGDYKFFDLERQWL